MRTISILPTPRPLSLALPLALGAVILLAACTGGGSDSSDAGSTPTPQETQTPTVAGTPEATQTPTQTAAPDGKPVEQETTTAPGKIAFSSLGEGDLPDIYVMDADGSNLTNLTNSILTFLDTPDNPAWSPDGKRIAFDASDATLEGLPQQTHDIYVMDADGSNLTNLTKELRGGSRADGLVYSDILTGTQWLPDGRIAFLNSGDIYTMSDDGSNLTNLTEGADNFVEASLSPSGDRIAFRSDQRQFCPDLYVMNADGSGETRLTSDCDREGELAWTPDGRITYVIRGPAGGPSNGIYIVDTDGSTPPALLIGGGGLEFQPESPAWSPDGMHFAVVDRSVIYIVSADGSVMTNVADLRTSRNFAWAPEP